MVNPWWRVQFRSFCIAFFGLTMRCDEVKATYNNKPFPEEQSLRNVVSFKVGLVGCSWLFCGLNIVCCFQPLCMDVPKVSDVFARFFGMLHMCFFGFNPAHSGFHHWMLFSFYIILHVFFSNPFSERRQSG